MAAFRRYVLVGIAVASTLRVASSGRADESTTLHERARVGTTTQVEVTLSARGEVRLAPLPGDAVDSSQVSAKEPEKGKPASETAKTKEAAPPKASTFPLKAEVQLRYVERILRVDDGDRPMLAARRVRRGASAVNVGGRPTTTALQPRAALLGVSRGRAGVTSYSLVGPLSRGELDVLETPGDPLILGELLPGLGKSVAQGSRWKVSDLAATALSSYDVLISNGLEARLVTLEPSRAVIKLSGEARGSRLGGEGTIAFDGTLTFDRQAGRIEKLVLERAETRRPGVVEEGLDVKSTLTVTREAAEAPPELGDEALKARGPLEATSERLRLLYQAPGEKYELTHDREWHLFHEEPRLAVFKRVEEGQFIAQCNLAIGPNAGAGRHQEPSQFRDDVKRTLGARFVQFLGVGEVDGDPAGHYRYKVGVQGRQGDLGLIWYYYLVASPVGDQIVATFTLAESRAKTFGDADERLMGAFRWAAPPPSAGR